jgi:hypothetical protein
MRFLTHDDGVILPSFSFRVGTIQASKANMVAAFGKPRSFKPEDQYGSKMSHEWTLLFGDGTCVAIYDYHRANDGEPVDTPITWSIAGLSPAAADRVHDAFRAHLADKALEFPKITPMQKPYILPALGLPMPQGEGDVYTGQYGD